MTTQAEATAEKTNVAKSSLIGAIFITILKIVVGVMTGSLGILAEAAHSALDFLAAGITYIAVKIADKPADKDHLYGHGKVENFSALIETVLLLATCFWVLNEAIIRLLSQKLEIEVSFWAFLVMGASIVVDYTRSRALSRVAKKYHNQALEADALHFSTDIWSSAVVVLGLIFAMFHVWAADAIAAILVAVIVMGVSIKLGKRTIDALMDKLPEGVYEKICDEVSRIEGVENIISLRVRQAGPKLFLDMTVALKRTLPFELAHEVVTKIEQHLAVVYPNSDAVIHAEPVSTEDETLQQKIQMLVAAQGMYPHHITANHAKGKIDVTLHLEYPKNNNFVEAHGVTETIEKKIREKLPEVNNIHIHIEELFSPSQTKDITTVSEELIKKIQSVAFEEPSVYACENISIAELQNGKWNIAMDCMFSADLSLDAVHTIVTKIENNIYHRIQNVESVLIHAEPSLPRKNT